MTIYCKFQNPISIFAMLKKSGGIGQKQGWMKARQKPGQTRQKDNASIAA